MRQGSAVRRRGRVRQGDRVVPTVGPNSQGHPCSVRRACSSDSVVKVAELIQSSVIRLMVGCLQRTLRLENTLRSQQLSIQVLSRRLNEVVPALSQSLSSNTAP